jgi:hypothetical protein
MPITAKRIECAGFAAGFESAVSTVNAPGAAQEFATIFTLH